MDPKGKIIIATSCLLEPLENKMKRLIRLKPSAPFRPMPKEDITPRLQDYFRHGTHRARC